MVPEDSTRKNAQQCELVCRKRPSIGHLLTVLWSTAALAIYKDYDMD